MEKKEVVYELGRWAPKNILDGLSRLFNFHCFICKEDFKGVSAYEHYLSLHPESMEGLIKGREAEYEIIEQKRRDFDDAPWDSEEPQEDILLSEPEHVSSIVQKVLPGFNVKKALKQNFKDFGDGRGDREDKEAPEGD